MNGDSGPRDQCRSPVTSTPADVDTQELSVTISPLELMELIDTRKPREHGR